MVDIVDCECELKEGQIEVWLKDEMDLANLVGAIGEFFLDGKLRGSVKVTPLEKSMQPPEKSKPMVPPAGVRMWLLEVPAVKNKYALCAFVGGWFSSSGFAYYGRHDEP